MNHEAAPPAETPLAPPTPILSAPSAPRPFWQSVLRAAGLSLFLIALFSPGVFLSGDKYLLPLFTRFMALALFAMSVDLIWGYTGLLSLGQGLYFGMGVYAVGFSLMFQTAAAARDRPLEFGPDMLKFALQPSVPNWMGFLINIWYGIALAVLLPALVAGLFGLVAFWRRIKGVYFSLLTQALLLATFTVMDEKLTYTGGRVGMPGLRKLELFGHTFTDSSLFYLAATVLCVCFLACLALVNSRFGKVLTAIRDSEFRVLALGYNTAMYKTFVFSLAGALAGLAGALYVAERRTAGPDVIAIPFSIEVVILVAVGGRGTLVGPIIGTILVNFLANYFNDSGWVKVWPYFNFQKYWPIIMGGLFIVVVVFLPQGIVGSLYQAPAQFRKLFGRFRTTAPSEVTS
jgi:urea transport system permease protein